MTLPRPKAIIFDWDNTLVDTWPVIHAAFNETLAYMGHEPWNMETTRENVGKSMRDSFPELFGERAEEAGEHYINAYKAKHLSMLNPLPGAKELLDWVKASNTPAVVVSNKRGPTLRTEVAHLGWEDYFAALVGATDATRDKPFPDPVHHALEAVKLKPDASIWFIGDSDVDLHTAENTGCTPILFGEHARAHAEFTPSHFRGHAYSQYAKNHDELIIILNK